MGADKIRGNGDVQERAGSSGPFVFGGGRRVWSKPWSVSAGLSEAKGRGVKRRKHSESNKPSLC